MGFFDALRRVLSSGSPSDEADDARKRIRAAWGLDQEKPPPGQHAPEALEASAYDRSQWQKRLRRVLEELPTSQSQWHDLLTDAQALNLEPDWIADRQREEFTFLVRRAVSDRVVSEDEHH